MKTGDRKPKLNKKPSRGMKRFMKQNLRSLEKAVKRIAHPGQKEQKWFTPKAVRAQWLGSFHRGNYGPHQGPQECARRVRQMANNTHGY